MTGVVVPTMAGAARSTSHGREADMTHPRKLSAWLAGALILAATLAPLSVRAQEKVILDTDFNVLGDDG